MNSHTLVFSLDEENIWFDVYLKATTGKVFSKEEVKLLNAIWVCTSYPDARLWNNRVAGLAASSQSTPELGLSAALSVSEATIYGGGPGVKSIDFLINCRIELEKGQNLKNLVTEKIKTDKIYGFGRPINNVDERLQWISKIACELGLDKGPHLKIAKNIESILLEKSPNLKMNYSAMSAGLCADLGFSVREYQKFRVPQLLAGMTPCWVESQKNGPNSLFKMDCSDISYTGTKHRKWQESEQ